MDIAEERRTAKSIGYLEGWARLNKEFRKAANADKRDYLKERCQHLEQSNKNPKEVSKVIKKSLESGHLKPKSSTTKMETH